MFQTSLCYYKPVATESMSAGSEGKRIWRMTGLQTNKNGQKRTVSIKQRGV